MGTTEHTRVIVLAIAACGLLVTMQREGVSQTDQQYSVASRTSLGPSRGLAAIDTAAREGKYLFMFIWKANDEQTRSMHGVFQSTMNKWAQSVNSVGIQVTDTREKPVVDKLGLSRAPMPMVLALAPNGAVTKAFPIQFDENKLRQAFVSPCMAQCLKGLQEQKLVLLCVQNDKTQYTQAAMTAAKSFAADARYAKATRIVALNPKDQSEATFLQDLKVDPHTTQAVTVLLAPPGQPVATFVGAVTKDQIVAKVQAGPCAGGKCGPNGCCPK